MYIPADALNEGYAPAEAHTLEERMSQCGVRIIPWDKVLAHKRTFARDSRIGIWKRFHLLPRAYVLLGDYASTYLFAAFIISMVACGALMGRAVGDPIVMPFAGGVVGGIAAIAAFVMFVALITGLRHGSSRYRDFVASGYYWRKAWYTLDKAGYPLQTPPEIQRKIRLLRKNFPPETRLFIEYFGRDPLIGLVHDGQAIYFGAWNTGTPFDSY